MWAAARLAACGLGLLLAGLLLLLLRGAGPRAPALEKAALARGWADLRTYTVLDPEGDLDWPSYRAPALVELGESLLAFAEARHGASEDGPSDIIVKRSDDGGVSWSNDPIVVVSNAQRVPGVDFRWRGRTTYGNPTPIALSGPAEVVLLFTVNETSVFLTRSSDGVGWSVPANISSQVKMPGWGRMATGPGHGLQLSAPPHAGRLVAPFSHMLQRSTVVQTQVWDSDPLDARRVVSVRTEWELNNAIAEGAQRQRATPLRHFAQNERSTGRVVEAGDGLGDGPRGLNAYEARATSAGALYSDDRGRTWHAGADIPALGAEGHTLAQLPSGELVSSFRTLSSRGSRCRHFASSSDAGITWALREQVPAEGAECAVPGARGFGGLTSMRGWLYATAPAGEEGRSALGLYGSSDGGSSWRLVGRPGGGVPPAHADLHAWPPLGPEPWAEVGVLYEEGPQTAGTISYTRAHLGNE